MLDTDMIKRQNRSANNTSGVDPRRLTMHLLQNRVQVRLQALITRNQHRQPVLLDHPEIISGINIALVEDTVDAVFEELGNDLGRAFKGDGLTGLLGRHGGVRGWGDGDGQEDRKTGRGSKGREMQPDIARRFSVNHFVNKPRRSVLSY